MNCRIGLAARLLVVLAVACAAHVRAADGPDWTFSGFGTLGAVVATTHDAEFHSNTRQRSGAGSSPRLGVDSRLGLQANVKFNNTFSAVGQLLIDYRDGGVQAEAEWLYAQAEVASWLKLRVGRMVLPVFLVSDSRNVGYATHWVRAPSEVYSLYPASAFDGAQAQVQADWGDTHLTLQASAGTAKVRIYAVQTDQKADLKDLYSLNLLIERGNWTFRIGDTESRNTKLTGTPYSLPPFTDSFRGLGVAYDNGKMLGQAEYVWRHTSKGGVLDMNGYYVTAGYRLGTWTPYATYSRFQPRGDFLEGRSSSRTIAAGLRWEAFQGVALKAQVESSSNNGLNFVNATPAFAAGMRKVNVFSLLVDFVF